MNRKTIKYFVNENGCHICTSHSLCNQGYPRTAKNGKHIRISRFIYEINYGSIPQGFCVLHKCDNPACINVNHFFLGTQADNIQDMVEKKRNKEPQGEDHYKAKLTFTDILKIREDIRSDIIIAKDYGVSPGNIWHIKNKKSWKHIA